MKKYARDLEIVIVNYNGSFWLKKVIQSLREKYLEKTKYRVGVTIVDNGSTDGSIDLLKNWRFDWLKKILAGENLGFARGNNIALREAMETSRFVMLMNSDVDFLDEGSNLDELIDYLKKNPEVGMVTPRLQLSDGKIDPACHRGEPTVWAAVTYFLGLEKLMPKSKTWGQYHQGWKGEETIHEIDALSGAALLTRSEVMEDIGLLDERFFMYAEDLDWCRRCREAGYRVVFNPEVRLVHYKNKSGLENENATIKKKTNRYFWTTMQQYYDKYYPDGKKFFKFWLKAVVFIKTN